MERNIIELQKLKNRQSNKGQLHKKDIEYFKSNYDFIASREKLRSVRNGIRRFFDKWNNENLVNPHQVKRYGWTTYCLQWINRGASVTGGALLFSGHTQVGGILAIVCPSVELIVSHVREKFYLENKSKWEEFERDARELFGIYRDFYHKSRGLGEIFDPIKNKSNELSEELNKVLNSLEDEATVFIVSSGSWNVEIKGRSKLAKRYEYSSQIHYRTTERTNSEKTEQNMREMFPQYLWSNWNESKNGLKSIENKIDRFLYELDNYLYLEKETESEDVDDIDIYFAKKNEWEHEEETNELQISLVEQSPK